MRKASIIALSSAVTQEDVSNAERTAKRWGFEPKISPGILEKHLAYAGTPEHRAEMLHGAFLDSETEVIFCVRGGEGVIHVLPLLDLALIRLHPKPFVGYSDYTILLNHLERLCGVPTYHGPTLRKQYPEDDPSGQGVVRALQGVRLEFPIRREDVLVKGSAEGRLAGGNVALLVRSLGTPYELDTKDAVLMMEAVNKEPAWLLDSFEQLAQARKFESCKGILLGHFKGCGDYEQYLFPFLERLNLPVFVRQPFGHAFPNMTLPLGRKAVLDSSKLIWSVERSIVERS